ncbi:MAG: hypothetical protein ACK56I_21880, partial [bacterium]
MQEGGADDIQTRGEGQGVRGGNDFDFQVLDAAGKGDQDIAFTPHRFRRIHCAGGGRCSGIGDDRLRRRIERIDHLDGCSGDVGRRNGYQLGGRRGKPGGGKLTHKIIAGGERVGCQTTTGVGTGETIN